MSFEGLQERLTALQETTAQLKGLIERLQTIDFQPGSVPLGADEDNVATELSTEIGQTLREEEEEIELLEEEVEDLHAGRAGSESEHTKTRLKDGVQRLKQELKSSRIDFRKAQLTAKRSLAAAQRLERRLLLQSFSQPVSQAPSAGGSDDEAAPAAASSRPGSIRAGLIRQRNQHQQQSSLTDEDKQTVGASGDVTAALRRTHDIIAAELARSEFAQQTLTESSAALSKLDESYGSLEGMLASSRDLLGTLVRSQKSDTWYLQTSFYMLLATLAWLVFRRWMFGPLWWLVFLPLKMMYGVVSGGASVGSGLVQQKGGDGKGSSAGVVFEEGKIEVDGIPGDDLPTVDVGQDAEPSDQVDPESLSDKIGQMLDDMDNGIEVDEQVEIPEQAEPVQQRDEL